MSLFNSVIGSLSPKFRSSFEDPHAREHELPLYNSPPSPRVPPPIASTVLWNAPSSSLSPPPRVPDHLLALQRRARYLQEQLQQLLDAQSDGLTSGLAGNGSTPDDLASNGSTTPTVSSIRLADKGSENEDHAPKKKPVSLNAARRGIFRRIQQLASIKAEELDILDEDLKDLQALVDKTGGWTQKRSRLEKKIKQMEGEASSSRTQELQAEASKLEQEIRQKEEELWALKTRHRRVVNELADNENSLEARLSTFKSSLSILDKEVNSFLAHPPEMNHMPLSSSPFLSLPPKRRTLEMAQDYWQEEHLRLADKCQEIDVDRAALDEGAVLWNDVVKKVVSFEANLQNYLQQAGRNSSPDSSKLLTEMDATVIYLEEKKEFASSRGWNLLLCAIGAELEAFKQGKDMLEEALGSKRKGKEKAIPSLLDSESSHTESDEEEVSRSAFRIGRTPPSKPTIPSIPTKPKLFDTDDEDPDPELLISHQDTDTD
ncbi:hypothetical protein BS50DRAFT_571520 [Corynespora cassiicola Philippines]|uniref:Autophagy-related protein 28 n=1 Tax=Corynespora cassiicola Philippines TaxID=1448308 RepID=A0A2T2NXY6_CORCC|nr:hypothetical protein BS50DRAFT_571520 [Corynespora cassiicola Philippines]